MAWVLLLAAGALEVVWASMLPATGGLTRPLPTVVFLVSLAGSMVLLARATQSLPLGTAYAVWVGVGAVGAALVGIAVHGDPSSPVRVAFLALLVAAIVGVAATTP